MCSIFSTVAKQPCWKMDTEHDYALRQRDIIHSFLPLQSKYSTSQCIGNLCFENAGMEFLFQGRVFLRNG
mgnify:CR=1 FL=1